MSKVYVDVVLPLALPPLTFEGGENGDDLAEGMYVSVGLGASRSYMGVVWRVHTSLPRKGRARPILSVARDIPPLPAQQMRLWGWIASYYMIPLGVVAKYAMTAPFKARGTQQEGGAVVAIHRPTIKTVALSPTINSEEELEAAFTSLKRAKIQYAALTAVVEALGEDAFAAAIPLKPLSLDSVIVKKLTDRGILTVGETEAPSDRVGKCGEVELAAEQQATYRALAGSAARYDTVLYRGDDPAPLLAAIAGTLRRGGNALLLLPELPEGNPLSGRIRDIFGGVAVFCLAEASADRKAQAYFRVSATGTPSAIVADGRPGPNAAPPNTQYTDSQPQGSLVVGSRQALFMPFPRLDLVVVMQEHDPLYKRNDFPPRIHMRDSALMLASLYGAKTILQSATASLESWFNATGGRYGLVEAAEEEAGAEDGTESACAAEAARPWRESRPPQSAEAKRFPNLPTDRSAPSAFPAACRTTISDTLRAAKRGERRAHLNFDLIRGIENALGAGGQVLLLQNRRGYSTLVECEACGWSPRCPHCNVNMVLHRGEHALRCHYCDAGTAIPAHCPDCRTPLGDSKGFGTEKIEAVVAQMFPGARVARLDSDVAPDASRVRGIVRAFRARETDILVGTQMVLHEFYDRRVALAAMLNADNILNMPDFRAGERMMQTVAFLARHSERLIIQTSQPDNPVLLCAASGDYPAFAAGQLAERRQFLYPPWCRLIAVKLAHAQREELYAAAEWFHAAARRIMYEGGEVSAPIQPTVERVQGRYIVEFILKVPRERSFSHAKEQLSTILTAMAKKHRAVEATINVDPQ